MVGIYKIESPSGKIYIGKSRDVERRHNVDYKYHNCKNQRFLYASIKKYGWDKHIATVLQEYPEDISGEELARLETVFIEWYRDMGYPMMNVDNGGNVWEGRHTETAIDRIRKGNTGKQVSEETKNKLKEVRKRNPMPEHQKERLRTCNVGRKQSTEEIEKRRNSNKGKKRTKEFCEKLREDRKGKAPWAAIMKAAELMRGKPGHQKGKRWTNGKQEVVTCPHCNKSGGINGLHRWHFDNCKLKK